MMHTLATREASRRVLLFPQARRLPPQQFQRRTFLDEFYDEWKQRQREKRRPKLWYYYRSPRKCTKFELGWWEKYRHGEYGFKGRAHPDYVQISRLHLHPGLRIFKVWVQFWAFWFVVDAALRLGGFRVGVLGRKGEVDEVGGDAFHPIAGPEVPEPSEPYDPWKATVWARLWRGRSN